MKTIEEKARAYDEALKRAKAMHDVNYTDSYTKANLETIFPELRESEDERIISSIIDVLKNDKKHYLEEIAWLERQKEQKQTDLTAGFYYIDLNGKRYYSKELRYGDMKLKVGEQKPADKDFPPLEGVDAIKAKYYDEGFKNGFDEGVDSVKPAEWSKEDETQRINTIIFLQTPVLRKVYQQSQVDKAVEWLRNLCPQPKQEWSEEDKQWLESIIREYEERLSVDKDHAAVIQVKIDLLKSLRPSWKPSEEQIELLEKLSNYGGHYGYQNLELKKLVTQLKKL